MSIILCLSWVPIMLERICGLLVQNNNTVDHVDSRYEWIIDENNNTEEEVDLPYEIIVDETNNTVDQVDLPYGRIVDENNNTVEQVDLPYEIITDILSRLPAMTVIHCTNKCKPLLGLAMTPSFIDLHLNRAGTTTTPVIAYHYQSHKTENHNPCEGNNYTQVVNVCFTPQQKSDNSITRTTRIDVCANHCFVRNCVPFLYGSCNGLLLFSNSFCGSLVSIWNPVTGEQNTVFPTPNTWGRVRGFFFHPKAEDYKVIFQSLAPRFGVNCFEYHIYGCKTKTVGSIQRYSHTPTGDRNPILLNGVLHWMVDDGFHKQIKGVYPSCSNSILLFDIHTEKFSTMSHPGGQCSEEGRHRKMQLMENEGHLYFCNPSPSHDIVIWKLDDYKNKVWVQIHVIQEPNRVLFGNPLFGGMVIPLDMQNDEIIIQGDRRDIFLYNMSFCSFRRIGNQFRDLTLLVYPFYHVDSLVSLKKSM